MLNMKLFHGGVADHARIPTQEESTAMQCLTRATIAFALRVTECLWDGSGRPSLRHSSYSSKADTM